jgi:hypothetical protein
MGSQELPAEAGETLREYIRCFSNECNALPNVSDTGVIGALLTGTMSHPVFKGKNRMHNYMYARIKFHTYSDFISE